jgi:Cdc6-like AAA superfamily ATPase
MADNSDNARKITHYARIGAVFTPGAPVDSFALFAGRTSQVMDVVDAINQRGQHVVLYGERGVGKTSLANVLSEVFVEGDTGEALWSAKVNCNTTDSYHSVWSNIFRELGREEEFQASWSERPPDPEDVRYLLQRLGRRVLIVMDELDRLEDDGALSQLADTIKTLSDNSVDATLVLVGVADSINELIGDHRSVERALNQVSIQRMSIAELTEIIDKGLARLDLEITDAARERIARLSEGLPHYTHLLALHAAQTTVMDERSQLTMGDVDAAIGGSVEKAAHSIRSDYQVATRSPRKDSQFAQVLLACALAQKDELGYFTARAVREPLTRIMGERREIGSFAKHLNKFTEPSRGCVLQKTGQPRRFFYRFENPLLQPFVILNGLAQSLIEESLLIELQDEARARNGDDSSAELD